MRKLTASEFLSELDLLIQEVDQHLTERLAGTPGIGTVLELQSIHQELSALRQSTEAGSLPPPSERWLAAARLVTDSWPFGSPLGERICRLADIYKRRVV